MNKKFKVGEKVIIINRYSRFPLGEIYTILRIAHNRKHNSHYDIDIDSEYYADEKDMEKAIVCNNLNKKLYPTYKNWRGYLIPEETYEKVKDTDV